MYCDNQNGELKMSQKSGLKYHCHINNRFSYCYMVTDLITYFSYIFRYW